MRHATSLFRGPTNNATVSTKWTITTGASVKSSPVVGANEMIYVGSDDNKLYALDKLGNEVWTFDANSDIRSSAAISHHNLIRVIPPG